jgi:hypothetical protein
MLHVIVSNGRLMMPSWESMLKPSSSAQGLMSQPVLVLLNLPRTAYGAMLLIREVLSS